MKDNQDKVNQLLNKLEALLKRQDDFSKEISSLKAEISQLKTIESDEGVQKEALMAKPVKPEKKDHTGEESITTDSDFTKPETKLDLIRTPKSSEKKPIKPSLNLEKFIGENLINKIGIIITVIGVGIGAKYSIEHGLISPLTRIILGYMAGLVLLGFGIKLKSKFENYSAVLVSGAIAIIYFITYAGYSFYELIPQVLAFGLMVVFTVFTVVAAINYNRQVIALIGLVGAYAVPFLLSDGSGRVVVLYSYMAIINIGILVIAFNKYWKLLYYSSFGLTWLIFSSWYIAEYEVSTHFGLALIFLTIFFVVFYLTFLAYKLVQKEIFESSDLILLLANSFIFYGIGYITLNDHQSGQHLLGLFTLFNAAVHLIVSFIVYRQKLADKNLFFLLAGLVLVFVTMAIPVQLDGNWVTILWVGEAAVLFWVGKTKSASVYEHLSYILMILAFVSILHDWTIVYDVYLPGAPETRITPLFNINFLTSILFISAFGFINYLHHTHDKSLTINLNKKISDVILFLIPAILIFTVYYSFRIEIATYWNQLFADSILTINNGEQGYRNYDLKDFGAIWIINYSLFFLFILSSINSRKLKNEKLGSIILILNGITIAAFLGEGLYVLSELRERYLDQTLTEYYQRGVFSIIIRYISFVFVAITLISSYWYVQKNIIKKDLKNLFEILLHFALVWIASSELINWMDIAQSTQSYKLGLSILWGVYALLLIIIGIWKKAKHLRIGAIALFGVTLVKLFFYDISHLNTISKTIVFVSLGVLLLIISFLYNKYKNILFDEGER
ncbi:MAG: DUF2339 domain-containing protein [Bacteroidota bacterium]